MVKKVGKTVVIAKHAAPKSVPIDSARVGLVALRKLKGLLGTKAQEKAVKRIEVLEAKKPIAHNGVGKKGGEGLSAVTSLPVVDGLYDKAMTSTKHKEDNKDADERVFVHANMGAILAMTKPPAWASLFPDKDWKQILSLEQLSTAYVYHTPQKSVQIATAKGMVTYQIEEISLDGGLSAYGLTAAGHPAILLFRGTSLYRAGRGMADTLVADLDPKGIGHTLYKKGSQGIGHWLALHGASKTIVTGHSLGAALATEAFARESDLIDEAYTFGSVKVNAQTAEKINSDPKRKKACVRFFAEDDKLAKFGQAGAGREICCIADPTNKVPEREKNWWRKNSWEHRRLYLTEPGVVFEVETRGKAKAYGLKSMLFRIARCLLKTFVCPKRFLMGCSGVDPGIKKLFKG